MQIYTKTNSKNYSYEKLYIQKTIIFINYSRNDIKITKGRI